MKKSTLVAIILVMVIIAGVLIGPPKKVREKLPEQSKALEKIPEKERGPKDPCEGRYCNIHCEYGYVEGSCRCECLPAP